MFQQYGHTVKLIAPTSSGGKQRLGSITKADDAYLRSLLSRCNRTAGSSYPLGTRQRNRGRHVQSV
jgi:transposase